MESNQVVPSEHVVEETSIQEESVQEEAEWQEPIQQEQEVDFDLAIKDMTEDYQKQVEKSIHDLKAELEPKSETKGSKLTKHQQRVNENFKAMIETISSSKLYNQKSEKPRQEAAKYLLGEVRPWGNRAECLPKTGLGLYKPRLKAKPIQGQQPLGKPLRM